MDVFRMVGSIALQGGEEAHRKLEQFDDKGRQSSKTSRKTWEDDRRTQVSS